MAFNANLEMVNGVAKITLVGELDANVAALFRAEIENAAEQGARRLALIMDRLDYMSSAGLRTLIFAKQKMGSGVDIYLVGAQPSVLETIEMTGFLPSVTVVADYQAAALPSL